MRYIAALGALAASFSVALASQAPGTTTGSAPPLAPTGGRGLTEVHGIKVGSHTMTERLTGCTVVLVDGEGVPGGVSQRGGAPGTSETDLLNPLNMVDKVNAIVLSGGSAYGLESRIGVMRYLEEHKIGWKVGSGVVPIVPAAPTDEPAPMLAASSVLKISPGPIRRPATKKSLVPRRRRLM